MATLDMLAVRIASALRPLVFAMQSEDGIRNAVTHLGWTLPAGPVPAAVTALAEHLEQLYPLLVQAASALNDAELDEPPAGEGDASDVDAMLAELALNLSMLIERLHGLRAQLATQLPGDYVAATGIADEFTERLFNRMLCMELGRNNVLLKAVLSFAGIIESSVEPEVPERFQPAFTRYRIHWDRLLRLFDPASLAREVYGWGTPQIDSARLFGELMPVSFALCMPAELRYATTSFAQKVTPEVPPATRPAAQLWLPVYRADDTSLYVAMTVLPKSTPEELQGVALALVPSAAGNVSLPFGTDLQLNVEASAQVGTGAALILRPDRAPQVVLDVEGAGQSLSSGRVATALVWKSPEAATPKGITANGGTGLTAGSISFGIGAEANGSRVVVFADLSIEDCKLTIAPPEEDGLLSSVLPQGLTAPFSFALRWSQDGLQFRGAAGLSTTLPMNMSVGVVRVQSLTLGIEMAQDSLTAGASLSASFKLGPAVLTLDRIGFAVEARSTSGNLGGADLDLRFKPPSGIGLAIDASSVAGGGDLFFDPDKGEYAGMLHLQIAERINVKAFGLLSTRLPDGGRGYSLIIFITAEDFQPIQLGMGFKLLGIGGMLAINRTFDEGAMREGLKNGTLGTLLFPQDPIHNAPAILRNLATVFPAQLGSYLFGPLAKIGWATPTLIQMELALILQIGARRRLLVLGRISSILPSREKDLIRLNMDAMGVLDFDVGTITMDAVLVDSRLLQKFVLTGSMAMRACVVPGRAAFALAVGGMNPHFAPPASMPKLDRITINLTSGNNPRFTCDAYFAVTANTIQFGSRSTLYAAAHGFSVEGEVGFDVLVQLLPFHFLADFYASIQLKRGSSNLFKVKVTGALEGPLPLRVKAKASFEILWCDFSVHFDKTLIGGERPAPPPAVNALEELKRALAAPDSWNADLPAARHGVVMRKLPTDAPLALDPLGQLTVKQSVLPLNTSRDLDVFGGAPLSGARRFTITAASLNTASSSIPLTPSVRPARDWFAPAQFFELSDEDKLASPSFEEMDSGIVFGSDIIVFDESPAQRVYAPLKYDTITIDEAGQESPPQPYELGAHRLHQQLRFAAVAKAAARNTGLARFRHPGAAAPVSLASPHWLVASTTDLNALAPDTGPGMSWGDARAALQELRRSQPQGATPWQLVPAYEVTR